MKFRKIVEGIPIEDLYKEVMKNKDFFGHFPIRTTYPGSAHSQVVDVLLRGPEIRLGSTAQDLQNTILCSDYPMMEEYPVLQSYLFTLMHMVRGTMLGRVVLTKLPPGGSIDPHKDEGEAADLYDRYHIVVASDNGNMFFSGEEQQEMLPGDIWWVDNHDIHWVENRGKEDRIHVVCDIFRG